MIIITLNGTEQTIDHEMTIVEMLSKLDSGKPGAAVAVNDEIVPRPEHAKRTVKSGDRVEIIRAVGGG